jgi:hypothetical protein
MASISPLKGSNKPPEVSKKKRPFPELKKRTSNLSEKT